MKATPKQARRIRRTLAAWKAALPPAVDAIAKGMADAGAPPEVVALARQVAAERVALALAEIDKLRPLIEDTPK